MILNEVLNDIPILEIVLENPFMLKKYPSDGAIFAVLDTGFEGFALIPEDVFKSLEFHKLSLYQRDLILPNGSKVQSAGMYGKIIVPELDISRDGFIETAKGIDEVVLGMSFAKEMRIVLDYCLNRLTVEVC